MFEGRSHQAIAFFMMTFPMFFIMVEEFKTMQESYITHWQSYQNFLLRIAIITRVINAIAIAESIVTIKRNLTNSIYE